MAGTSENFTTLLEGKLATLRTIQPLLDNITSDDPVINWLKSVLTVITAQIIEIKSDVFASSIDHQQTIVRTAKTEQYSRRNTTVLVGLPVDSSESDNSSGKLVENVAKKLTTVFGINVKSSDLSAVHRNAQPKVATSRTRQGNKASPPSVTVCFYNSNLKDNVLMKYSNFDTTKKQSRDVRLYQSLSKFYSNLTGQISSKLETKLGKGKVKWIHWRSQSTGFVVRLKNSENTTFKNIFCLQDFEREFSKYDA
jgi:RNase H-fold protein (predicted Holliday junction resolvase)